MVEGKLEASDVAGRIIELTKEVNALREALMHISHIDGSDPVEEIRLARKLARRALFGNEDAREKKD